MLSMVKTMSNTELQPNPNIERAVLSSIIFDPYLLDSAYSDLKTADFLMDFHKKVFRAMKVLQKLDKPVDDKFIRIELEEAGLFDEGSFLDILSANPITDAAGYKNKLKEISKAQYFKLKKAEILAKELSAVDEIRELEKLFDSYRKATVLEPILNIVNSKNITATTPKFFLEKIFPIQQNEITMISAGGGSGKSFVALWAAAQLREVHNLNVFAYLSEDKVEHTKKRLETIRKANYTLENTNIDYAGKDKRPQPFLMKTNEGGFEPSVYFEDFKKALKHYDIIILDPLIAFIYEDENSNVEARAMFNILNEWCDKENKTIIIIHHHSKEDRMRGASAFVDAVRVHYTIENPAIKDKATYDAENKNKKNVEPYKAKTYNHRIAKIMKTNHYPAGADLEFKVPLFAGDFEIVYEDKNGEDVVFSGAEVSSYEMPTLDLNDVVDEHTKVVKIVDFEE